VASWTRLVLRFRRLVVVFWLVVAVAGFVAYEHLAPILTNQFTVPGTDSERVRVALEDHFGDRPDGSFTAVFELRRAADPGELARLQRVVDRAARVVPSGKPTKLNVAGPKVVFGDVVSPAELTLSAADVERKLSPRTRAITVVPRSRSATIRLRGLCRELPLPCANSTTPRALSGTARSASSATSAV